MRQQSFQKALSKMTETGFRLFFGASLLFAGLTACYNRWLCLAELVLVLILSVPCVLGYNLWSFIQPLGEGTTLMDLEDFIVSNLLLPMGSLTFIVFCTSRYGWGWKNFVKEANEGRGLKVAGWMRGYMTFVLPVLVLVLLIIGIFFR